MYTKTLIRTIITEQQSIFYFFEEKNISFEKKTLSKILKPTISQKLENCTKKNYLCEKLAPGQFQSTLKIWPLMQKVEFLGPN